MRKAAMASALGALTMGILCGLIPLKYGQKKNLPGWGVAGLIASIIGAFMGGILIGLPAAILFAGIIHVSAK
jgi:hypothetical protein